jgi:hypothetical protein
VAQIFSQRGALANAGRVAFADVLASDCRRPIMQTRVRLKHQRRGLVPNFQVVLSKQLTIPHALYLVTIRNSFLFSIVISTATMLYSVSEMRGLFADGSNYVVHVLASEDFFLLEPARKLVQLLQQSLLVFGIRSGVTDLPTLAKLFTLGALGWPIILTGSCWLILPREEKGWIIGPLINLVAIIPMTSLAAIGEGMIASCFLWIIFFLVLFRTRSVGGAALAIPLTMLGAVTHESAAVFFVGIGAIAIMRLRGSSAVEWLTQFAISAAAIWSACYLVSVILHPRDPVNVGDFLIGVLALAFVELQGVNLTAVATIVAFVSIFRIMRAQNKVEKTQTILLISISLFALTAVLLLLLPEWTVTPVAEFSGRGLPVLGTTLLSFGLWAGWRNGVKPEVLLSKPALLVLCGLLLTQSVAQVMMTRQWANTLATVSGIIERGEGRVPWQTALKTAAPRNPIIWTEMTWYSEIQALSLLLAPQGRVHALIDAPTFERWKPFQLDAPASLPKSRFWDAASYATAVDSRNLRQ